MHPRDCPSWEYKYHPHYRALAIRCEAILNSLGRGEIQIDRTLGDTRQLHEQMFGGLTPDLCPYYAGHYRGENYKCLRHNQVQVRGDSRVGVAANRVAPELANFSSHIVSRGIKATETAFNISDTNLPPGEKLYYLVKFACRALVEFLRIHPYVNGNGHVGRLIVWLLLERFGYWPKAWPLDGHPPYDALLSRFRDGDESPLEAFVLSAIIGPETGTVGP